MRMYLFISHTRLRSLEHFQRYESENVHDVVQDHIVGNDEDEV